MRPGPAGQGSGGADDGALRQALGLTPAARRAGVLRFTRQGKRALYRGAWILA